MNKQKVLSFIDNQIKELDRKIRDIKYEGYDYENIHQTMDYFCEISRFDGAKKTLITMRNIIENMED